MLFTSHAISSPRQEHQLRGVIIPSSETAEARSQSVITVDAAQNEILCQWEHSLAAQASRQRGGYCFPEGGAWGPGPTSTGSTRRSPRACPDGLTVKQKSPWTSSGHLSTTWKPQHVLGAAWSHRARSPRVGPSGPCPHGPSVLAILTFEVRCVAGFLTYFT